MSTPHLSARELVLIEIVLDLLATPHSDPRYPEAFDRVLGLCKSYLIAARDASAGSAPRLAKPKPKNLGRRIVELAGGGMGVRQIARVLRCAPSTVSRTINRRRPQ